MFYTLLLTYVVGGLTFVPLIILTIVIYLHFTFRPCQSPDLSSSHPHAQPPVAIDLKLPTLKSWVTVRKTFESTASTSYISIVRTLLDSRSGHHRRTDDAYYAVLKGNVVYLYEDEPMTECSAAIDVTKCTITIYPSSNLLDGELFAKRNALLIKEIPGNEPDSLLPSPWYMFFKSVSAMEDWYLALLAAQGSTPPPYPLASHAALISSLDALPDLIPTRWLNAILGRLFLAVKGTRAVETWVIARLMKKLNKIKKPSFLTSVVVRSFEAGDIAPIFSKPMLKELTPEGEASIGVDVSYEAPPGGEIRITVSAIATFSLPSTPSLSLLGLGGGKSKDKENQDKDKDKPYEVSLVLAVVLRRLSGNVLIKIKRPPSNRIWYCFTTMPQMEMTVEPLVSDRQIKWSMVLSVIESKLREVIQESVVLPHMDDIPFFDTSSFETRGGIFAEAFKQHSTVSVIKTDSTVNFDAGASDASDTDNSKILNDSLIIASLSDSDGGSSLGPVETPSNSMRKRRSWFARIDGKDSSPQPDLVSTHKRGKSLDDSSPVTNDVRVVITDEDHVAEPKDLEMEQQQPQRRAQSHNSRIVLPESLASSFNPTDSSSGLSRSAPSSSLMSSLMLSTPQPSTTTTSGSLLATLRSRGAVMAEKPKEAMKKWGVNVNWGTGLRKGDKESDKLQDKTKDDWELNTDHGELWGERKDLTPSRTSFAELRRKVEAREKERAQVLASAPTSELDDNGGQSRTTRSSETKPIDILEVSRSQTATPSPTPADISRKSSPPNGTTSFLSPSAPRTTTELHTHTSTHVVTPPREPERGRRPSSAAVPDSLPVVEATPMIPIRAQPRAAMMVIPGIHVSHRNDIMALSSAPAVPQLRADENSTPLLTPGLGSIQTVRRLFRGNGIDIKDNEEKRSMGTSSPEPVSAPPPLPPRKQCSEIDCRRRSPSPVSKAVTPPDSPASHALKQVAEQDAARKPPPLPARRNTPTVVTRPSTATSGSEDSSDMMGPPTQTGFNSQIELPIQENLENNTSETELSSNNSGKPPLPPRRFTFPASADKGE